MTRICVGGSTVRSRRRAWPISSSRRSDPAKFERAARLIQRARQRDPRGAWVYIALAQASLANGYRKGSRFRAEAYVPGTIERARRFARRALARGPEQSLAHATLGQIALIENQPAAARYWLNRAQRLDPAGFHPRLLRSVLHRRTGERARAEAALAAAEARRHRPYHGEMLRNARQALALASPDGEAAEP